MTTADGRGRFSRVHFPNRLEEGYWLDFTRGFLGDGDDICILPRLGYISIVEDIVE